MCCVECAIFVLLPSIKNDLTYISQSEGDFGPSEGDFGPLFHVLSLVSAPSGTLKMHSSQRVENADANDKTTLGPQKLLP